MNEEEIDLLLSQFGEPNLQDHIGTLIGMGVEARRAGYNLRIDVDTCDGPAVVMVAVGSEATDSIRAWAKDFDPRPDVAGSGVVVAARVREAVGGMLWWVRRRPDADEAAEQLAAALGVEYLGTAEEWPRLLAIARRGHRNRHIAPIAQTVPTPSPEQAEIIAALGDRVEGWDVCGGSLEGHPVELPGSVLTISGTYWGLQCRRHHVSNTRSEPHAERLAHLIGVLALALP